MSDNSNRPLTRREIREREQAAAAAAAAAQGGGGGPSIAGPSSGQYPPRSGYGAPPVPPSGAPPRPASAPQRPAPAPAPSRRALRDTGPGPGFPSQAPVVRPPTTSGGVRGIDETGRLTPVQRTSGDAPVRPATPTSSAPPPSRTSTRQPFGGSRDQGAPGVRGTSAADPAPRAFGSGGIGSAGIGSAAAPQAAPSSPPSPWSTSAPASVPPSRPDLDNPFGSPRTPDSVPSRSAAPALPWETAPAEPPAGPASPFDAPARPTSASPFDALVGAEQPVRARASVPQIEDDDEDEWEEPESSYTWLHYIVLIVVAFVLGLLIWKLLLDGPSGGFETEQAAAVLGTYFSGASGGAA